MSFGSVGYLLRFLLPAALALLLHAAPASAQPRGGLRQQGAPGGGCQMGPGRGFSMGQGMLPAQNALLQRAMMQQNAALAQQAAWQRNAFIAQMVGVPQQDALVAQVLALQQQNALRAQLIALQQQQLNQLTPEQLQLLQQQAGQQPARARRVQGRR